MTRSALAPRWWAWHLALVAVLVSFGWLGWWQLDTFRGAAPGTRSQGSVPRAVPVEEVTRPGGRLDADAAGRIVRAGGSWDADGQLLVPGREVGARSGSLVVTPLRTPGGVLPVVRGWVPRGDPGPAPPPGAVTVTGVLQRSETEASAGVPPGSLPEGQVAYVATVTLLDRLPYDTDQLYDGFLVLRSQTPADQTGLARVAAEAQAPGATGTGRWRNLAYGLQWWLFAVAAVFFWWSVLRRAVQESPPDRGRETTDPAAARSPVAPRGTT